ncbi:hypothetical protein HN51_030806 [Arachis hypogaea]
MTLTPTQDKCKSLIFEKENLNFLCPHMFYKYGEDNSIRVIYHGYGHYDTFKNSNNTTYSQK